jgi:mono/diheme cytochrome c family protein
MTMSRPSAPCFARARNRALRRFARARNRALRWRKQGLSCFLLLLVAGAWACGPEEREPGQWPISRTDLARGAQAVEAGEGTYRRYCVGCHGADGRGNGGITGADFVAGRELLGQKPDAELTLSVREGKRGERAVMPAHKPVLNDAQIADVVAYVRRRFFQSATPKP